MKNNKRKADKKTVTQPQSEGIGKTFTSRFHHIFSISLILIISIAIYSNILSSRFVFDDIESIVENYKIRDLSNFWPPSGNRYIGFLSFAINYHFGKLDVFGYHLFNIIIHIINGLLVYSLILLTLKTPVLERTTLNSQSSIFNRQLLFLIPLTVSLVFVSHPIQTQAVTYIVQRFTSLCTLFYLLSLVLYIKARSSKQLLSAFSFQLSPLILYLLSIISAILAMKTKEISFTLPFVVILYEFMFFSSVPLTKGGFRGLLIYLSPFLIALFIIPLSLIGVDKPIGDIIGEIREVAQETEEIPRWVYLLTQFKVIGTYIRLLFIPINQNLDYDYPLSHSLFEAKTFISLIFLLTIFAFSVYLFLRSRRTEKSPSPIRGEGWGEGEGFSLLISFGIFWFFITLSVESSIIPIRDVINEHRLYLPSIGLITAFSSAVFYGFKYLNKRFIIKLSPFLISCILLLATVFPLGIAVYQRNKVWRDELSLWMDVVNKSPNKARGHNGLGVVYEKQKQFDEAIKEYKMALTLKPNYDKAHNNLGNVYNKQGRIDDAINEYLTAIKFKPDMAEAHNNLGDAYNKQGRIDDAINEYLTAIKFKPDMAEAYNNIGNIYYSQGRIDDAINEYLTAIKFKPNNTDFHFNLGNTYYIQGRLNEAIKEYLIVLRFKPDHWDTHNNLGNVYMLQERLEEALKEYSIAVKIRPDSPDVHISLGLAYYKLGQKNRAIEELEIALRLKPDYLPARQALESLRRFLR